MQPGLSFVLPLFRPIVQLEAQPEVVGGDPHLRPQLPKGPVVPLRFGEQGDARGHGEGRADALVPLRAAKVRGRQAGGDVGREVRRSGGGGRRPGRVPAESGVGVRGGGGGGGGDGGLGVGEVLAGVVGGRGVQDHPGGGGEDAEGGGGFHDLGEAVGVLNDRTIERSNDRTIERKWVARKTRIYEILKFWKVLQILVRSFGSVPTLTSSYPARKVLVS
mmetsp:Transcript_30308/g.69448  ORF Transcript_30308/g.69448 Transcript_30308/m.69448 type:complete len:219 (-) Transcript_30308:466-1122(-)